MQERGQRNRVSDVRALTGKVRHEFSFCSSSIYLYEREQSQNEKWGIPAQADQWPGLDVETASSPWFWDGDSKDIVWGR